MTIFISSKSLRSLAVTTAEKNTYSHIYVDLNNSRTVFMDQVIYKIDMHWTAKSAICLKIRRERDRERDREREREREGESEK